MLPVGPAWVPTMANRSRDRDAKQRVSFETAELPKNLSRESVKNPATAAGNAARRSYLLESPMSPPTIMVAAIRLSMYANTSASLVNGSPSVVGRRRHACLEGSHA